MMPNYNAPLLIRVAAFLTITLIVVAVVGVWTVDHLLGREVPADVSNLLWALVTPALAWLSAERGVTLTNGDTAQALKTLAARVNGDAHESQQQPAP